MHGQADRNDGERRRKEGLNTYMAACWALVFTIRPQSPLCRAAEVGMGVGCASKLRANWRILDRPRTPALRGMTRTAARMADMVIVFDVVVEE